ALESVLTQKGYVEPAALDLLIETYEKKIGPHNGARVVAKAWVDEEFKQGLLADPTHLIASLRLATLAFRARTWLLWRTRLSFTTWSSVRCALAIRGRCWGFRRYGISRHPTARGRSRIPAAYCAISVSNFRTTRKSACGIPPLNSGISFCRCVR